MIIGWYGTSASFCDQQFVVYHVCLADLPDCPKWIGQTATTHHWLGFLKCLHCKGKTLLAMPSWPNQTKNWSFWSSTSRQSSTNACLQMPKDSTDQHGITTAAKSPRVFVTLDLWMNLQRYGISAPRQVTHKTYYSIENNLSNKYLAIAKWKLQGNYFLYCDVERCGTMFGLTQLCNCPTGRDWVLVCFHHDACGLPFFVWLLGRSSRVSVNMSCWWCRWVSMMIGSSFRISLVVMHFVQV